MPFTSKKQMKYMFANHPDIAQRWVDEAKQAGEPPVQPDKKAPAKKTPVKKKRGG